MLHDILLALHIISFVSWFAALLYLGRLFVYHVETDNKAVKDQFEIMERRLFYAIGYPAMAATLLFGIWLMISTGAIREGWMHIKLLLVIILVVYHHVLGRVRKNLRDGKNTMNSKKLRVLNEVGTALLILIVFVAVLKI